MCMTDESVLFIEVSLIQKCPYREVPLYIYILQSAIYSIVYKHGRCDGECACFKLKKNKSSVTI